MRKRDLPADSCRHLLIGRNVCPRLQAANCRDAEAGGMLSWGDATAASATAAELDGDPHDDPWPLFE